MASAREKLVVIAGPTASGKTELAIQLAQKLDGRVVSADSRQVYASMNIGTAKPDFAWREETHEILTPDQSYFDSVKQRRVSHYLLNIRHPNDPLALSDWQAAADLCIKTIHAASMPAILVGGTMLYIDCIVKNYDLPAVQANEEFRQEKDSESVENLYASLLAQDPAARNFVEPGNKRRIIRALEVMTATNRTFSELRKKRLSPYETAMIGLFDSWHELERRIGARVAHMLANGLLEETQTLIDQYGADLPLLRTMNYKQATAILQGKSTQAEARDDMQRANVRYAKRQMRWWRNRNEITWFEKPSSESIAMYLQNLRVRDH